MTIYVGGVAASDIELIQPWKGCWEVRAILQGPLPKTWLVDWRGWKILGGRPDPDRSGTFAAQGRVVLVGGLGWGTLLDGKFYQADQGLRASTIALDLARSVGESIVVDASVDFSPGRYWARRRETAGGALTRLFGSGWYVGLDSVTRVASRTSSEAPPGVEPLDYNAHDGEALVFAMRPDAVPLGCIMRHARLPGPRRVTNLAVHAAGDKERIRAHTEAA